MKKFTRINYLVNDSLSPVAPGSILMRDNGRRNNFTLIGNVFDMIDGLSERPNLIASGAPHLRYYLTDRNVSVDLNPKVGNLVYETMASISFSGRNSAFIIYDQGVKKVLQWGSLRKRLTKLWTDEAYVSNFRNYFLVSSVIETPDAIALYAMENRTSVRLEGAANTPLVNMNSLLKIDTGLLSGLKSVGVIKVQQNAAFLIETIRWDRSRKSFTPYIPG